MSVQVKESQVRETPSFLGKIVAEVKYRDKVTLLETSAWYKVQAGEQTGWIHPSALLLKKKEIKAGAAANTTASADEVVAASKGFDKEMERSYRNENPRLAFSVIDEMEKQHATVAEVVKFAQDGKLKSSAGGGQ